MAVKHFLLGAVVVAALVTIAAEAAQLELRPRDAHVQPFLSRGNLYQKSENAFYLNIPQNGAYTIRLTGRGDRVEGEWPILALAVNGIERDRITLDSATSKQFTRETHLDAGVHKVGFVLLNEAGGFFSRRTAYLEALVIQPPEGAPLPALSDEKAWTAAAAQREARYIEASRERIADLRMGEARFTLTDAEGQPLDGVDIEIRQVRHEFLFGGLLAGFAQYPTAAANEEYRQRFADIFNYATLPFYWALFEPERGKRNHDEVTAMLEWCEARGIVTKGHTLLWDNEAGIPPWSSTQPPASVQEAFVRETMDHYRGRIPFWEVVNEPVNHPGVKIMPAHRWAREADPDARLVINEYGIFYEGHPDFWDFLKKAVDDDVPFDAIGIQAHAPVNMAFPLDRVWHILDRYAELGKAIHITEFTPASNNTRVLGSEWRGRWTEAQQADYAEAFYRVCFAHPAVEAISWWDFADTGAWLTGGGMLRADRTPKPVYERLHRLIKEEWHTNETAKTADDGTARFHGYYGHYELRLTHNDEEHLLTLHHTPETPPQSILQLPN